MYHDVSLGSTNPGQLQERGDSGGDAHNWAERCRDFCELSSMLGGLSTFHSFMLLKVSPINSLVAKLDVGVIMPLVYSQCPL